MEVRLLTEEDDRSTFASGDLALDRFFREYAGQNQFLHHIGTTYVAVEAETIFAFVTVAGGHLERGNVPESHRHGLPRYPLPILRLARIAVDRAAQGRGIGTLLLHGVFRMAGEMATRTGCIGVVVDAKPQAVAWYQQYGFMILRPEAGTSTARPQLLPMFLPLAEIELALAATRDDAR